MFVVVVVAVAAAVAVAVVVVVVASMNWMMTCMLKKCALFLCPFTHAQAGHVLPIL